MSGYNISITGNSNDSDLVLASSNGSITETTSANLTGLETKTSTLETKTSTLETKTATLETKTATLETKTATLETKTATLETSMNSVQLEVDNLNDKRIAVLYDGTLNNGFNVLASQGSNTILTQMTPVTNVPELQNLFNRPMLVGLGYNYGDFLKSFALSKPANTVFAALDYSGFTDASGGGVNVLFKEDELSFPIGMLCGLKSQSLDVSGSVDSSGMWYGLVMGGVGLAYVIKNDGLDMEVWTISGELFPSAENSEIDVAALFETHGTKNYEYSFASSTVSSDLSNAIELIGERRDVSDSTQQITGAKFGKIVLDNLNSQMHVYLREFEFRYTDTAWASQYRQSYIDNSSNDLSLDFSGLIAARDASSATWLVDFFAGALPLNGFFPWRKLNQNIPIKVGFIGGFPIPLIQRFENGFKAGVEYIHPSAIIDVSYVNTSWNDISTNYNIAMSMYNSGKNVIYHAAGDGGIGVFMAAKKYSEDNSRNVYVCGPDQDTYLYNTTGIYEDLKPYVLTGSIKHTGNALKYLVKEYINNGFDLESQNISLGFSEKALDYAPIRNGLLSTDRIGIVNRTINEIKATSYPLPERSISLDVNVNSDLSRIYVGEYTLNGLSSSMVFAFSSDFSYCNNLSLANPFATGIPNISDICSNVLIDSHLYSDKTYYNFSPWDKTSVANAKLSLLEISSNSVESRYRYVIDGSDADLPMMYNRSFLDIPGSDAVGLPGYPTDVSDVYTVGEIFRTFVHNKITDTISVEGPMYLIRHDLSGNEYEPSNRVANPQDFVAAQLNRVCVRIQ